MRCHGEVVFLSWCQYFLLCCGVFVSVVVTTRSLYQQLPDIVQDKTTRAPPTRRGPLCSRTSPRRSSSPPACSWAQYRNAMSCIHVVGILGIFCLFRAWRFLRYRKLMRLEQTFDVPTHLAFLERVPQWFDEMPLGARPVPADPKLPQRASCIASLPAWTASCSSSPTSRSFLC